MGGKSGEAEAIGIKVEMNRPASRNACDKRNLPYKEYSL